MKSFKEFLIQEAAPGSNIPKGNTKVSVFPGRMAPLHIGHHKIISSMKYKPVILLVKGVGTSADKIKNPFDEQYQEYLIKKCFPKAEVRSVKNANLTAISFHLRKSGLEVAEVFAGDDRMDSYKQMIERLNQGIEDEGLKYEVEFHLTPRITSATKVRDAIRGDDEKTFRQLMPRVLWNEWETMKEKLKDA
jgi:nicotinamide mononucleotide adenylyltransferase